MTDSPLFPTGESLNHPSYTILLFIPLNNFQPNILLIYILSDLPIRPPLFSFDVQPSLCVNKLSPKMSQTFYGELITV